MGITIFHITHDLTEAFFLADHLAVMKDGIILQQDIPENVLGRPADRVVAELLGIENLIPGDIKEDGGFFTRLGLVKISIPSFHFVKSSDEFYLTVPGWCVELVPKKEKNRYAWTGRMRIAGINSMNGQIELDLVHAGGGHLRTCLSRREIGNMPVSVEAGAEVPVGILKEGVYCIPTGTRKRPVLQ